MNNRKQLLIKPRGLVIEMALVFILCSPILGFAQNFNKAHGRKLLDSLLAASEGGRYEIRMTYPLDNNLQLIKVRRISDCEDYECRKSTHGLVSLKGDTLLPIFDNIIELSTGNMVLVHELNSFQVTPTLKVIKVYDQFNDFEGGIAVFVENGKYGICNTGGSVLLKPTYDYLASADNLNRIPALKDNQWSILERKGNKILPKAMDTTSTATSMKLLKIQDPKTQRWALLNEKAELITTYKYQTVIPFQGGTAIGQINYLWGLIGNDGTELSEFVYEKIFNSYGSNYMVALGDSNLKYGLISEHGEEIIPTNYKQISKEPLHSKRINGLYWVVEESDGQWGLLNLSGQPLTAMTYEKVDVKDYDNPKGMMEGKWVELLKR